MQRLGVCALSLAMFFEASGIAPGATLDESVQGDLSANGAAPTQWTLDAGDNTLLGSAGTDVVTGADYDVVTLIVPAGMILESLFLTKHEIDFGQSFMGWMYGDKWTAGFGAEVDGNQLFRYQLFDANYIGFDLLPDISLPSGSYTIELQDIHVPFGYGFRFTLVPVPEPAAVCMAAIAILGMVCQRR